MQATRRSFGLPEHTQSNTYTVQEAVAKAYRKNRMRILSEWQTTRRSESPQNGDCPENDRKAFHVITGLRACVGISSIPIKFDYQQSNLVANQVVPLHRETPAGLL